MQLVYIHTTRFLNCFNLGTQIELSSLKRHASNQVTLYKSKMIYFQNVHTMSIFSLFLADGEKHSTSTCVFSKIKQTFIERDVFEQKN